jgi:hypothetical protein
MTDEERVRRIEELFERAGRRLTPLGRPDDPTEPGATGVPCPGQCRQMAGEGDAAMRIG